MRLSLITIHYDDFEGLTRTADSVVKELKGIARSRVQWILVDGNSPEPSSNWIKSNSQLFDRVFQECDAGIYDAMNKGLGVSTGHHVLFLNAGEEFSDGGLQEILDSVVSENVTYLFGGTVNYFSKIVRYRPPRNIGSARHSIPALHQATVYAKEHIPKGGYDLNYPICADHWMAAMILKARRKVAIVDVSVCIHHIHGGAASKNIFATFMDSFRVQRNVLHLPYYFCVFSFLRKVAVWAYINTRIFFINN